VYKHENKQSSLHSDAIITVSIASCSDSTTPSNPSVVVSNVVVSPDSVYVSRGFPQQFGAEVTGTNNPPQTVTWSVIGGVSGTNINPNTGLLIVSTNQPVGTLTVRATSTYDTSKTGTATVYVMDTQQPTISVKIDNNNLTFVYLEEYQADGMWYLSWRFFWSTAVVSGNTYGVLLNVDGNEKTSNLNIVYTPEVFTNPANFNHSQAMTYNWTLSQNSQLQAVYFGWSAWSGYQDEVEYALSPSDRMWVVPANTVLSDWEFVGFALVEANYQVVGNTVFISSSLVTKDFTSMVTHRDISERERMRRIISLIRKNE